jgi:phosphoribosylformylglycinamidine (FGAM) synthase-like amidotransferase family enzyme
VARAQETRQVTTRRPARVALWAAGLGAAEAMVDALAAQLPGSDCKVHGAGDAIDADVVIVAAVSLEAGPLAAAVQALRAFVAQGGSVMGVGVGATLVCEAGLLPGAVRPSLAPSSPSTPSSTHVRVEGRTTPFTWAIPAGRVLPLPDARASFEYVAAPEMMTALGAHGGVVLRYCDAAGGASSMDARGVAACCDATGRVVAILGGLAPFPAPFAGALGRQVAACLDGSRRALV